MKNRRTVESFGICDWLPCDTAADVSNFRTHSACRLSVACHTACDLPRRLNSNCRVGDRLAESRLQTQTEAPSVLETWASRPDRMDSRLPSRLRNNQTVNTHRSIIETETSRHCLCEIQLSEAGEETSGILGCGWRSCRSNSLNLPNFAELNGVHTLLR